MEGNGGNGVRVKAGTQTLEQRSVAVMIVIGILMVKLLVLITGMIT